jgi:putative peptide zinc metalloprotease protein
LLLPLKHTIYLLPILLIAALFISARHALLIEEDLIRLRDSKSFIEHALLSMVTVNLLVTLVTAIVAYTYRATVSGFCIVFVMGFFPRFMVRIGHVRQLLRRERIWLHAAPLLLRLGLFSFGILMWFNTRTMDGFLSPFGLIIAAASMISFFITVNPLVKSSGYHLLAAFLNEPRLRGKAYMALFNKFRGNVYKKADNNVLAAYALASILFMVVIFAVFLLLFGRFLKIHLGGAGVLLIVFISLTLLLRMITKFKKIEQLYERSVQFERWRDRTLPKVENDIVTKESQNVLMTYLRRALFFLFLVVLFVPYNYESGGNFVILPNKQQEITTELSGIIDEIYFDGGETLKKGTVIGRLSYSDYLAQVKIYTAKMQEQQAVINELKSRPKPEEVQLAERVLEVEKTRAQFSKAKLSRLEKLYEEKTISFEDLDDARREYGIDLEQVEEKRANLELIKSGVPPDKIASTEAKLQSLKEQRDYNQQKIELSVFYMPFDGKLITMHLKQKIGSYFDKGETLAVAENTDQVDIQIEVPESDIGYVVESARIRARPLAYHSEDFTGVVTAIDAEVTETRSGKVVRIITSVENKDGRLKAGMTGYAKISCGTLPVWKILSLDIVRFVKVEGWSWLP